MTNYPFIPAAFKQSDSNVKFIATYTMMRNVQKEPLNKELPLHEANNYTYFKDPYIIFSYQRKLHHMITELLSANVVSYNKEPRHHDVRSTGEVDTLTIVYTPEAYMDEFSSGGSYDGTLYEEPRLVHLTHALGHKEIVGLSTNLLNYSCSTWDKRWM